MTSFNDYFAQEVGPEFRFLVKDFGFHELSARPTVENGEHSHRYERDGWFVEPFYSTWGHEVNVHFGTSGEGPFSLHMFLGIVNPRLYYQLGASIAKTESDVKVLLQLYASALRVYGQPILARDPSAIDQVKAAKTSGVGLCPPYYRQPPGQQISSRFV